MKSEGACDIGAKSIPANVTPDLFDRALDAAARAHYEADTASLPPRVQRVRKSWDECNSWFRDLRRDEMSVALLAALEVWEDAGWTLSEKVSGFDE